MRSILKTKKGQIGTLPATIILLVLAGTFLIFGLIMLEQIRDTDVLGGTAENQTSYLTANKTVVGLGTFGDFWEIIVLAIVIAVVIGLLLVVFGGTRSR